MTIYIYILIFLLLLLGELLYFKVADKYNIIDKPNERSSHTRLTLRGGGVIFYLGALIFGIVTRFEYPWFLAGLTLITAVSFIDDVRSVPNRIRIVIQFIAMGLMFYQLGLFAGFPWWYTLVALIVSTGIINAFNFMDGINGMTGGYSLAVVVPLIVLNNKYGFIDAGLLYITGMSLVVFCLFNFRKRAKCFAGDVGAVSIAFILLFALGKLILYTGNIWYILLLAVYGVDTISTICRRLYLKENIFRAHRRHAYQLLANELKFPHPTVSSAYAFLQLLISFTAVYFSLFNPCFLIFSVLVLSMLYISVVMTAGKNRG